MEEDRGCDRGDQNHLKHPEYPPVFRLQHAGVIDKLRQIIAFLLFPDRLETVLCLQPGVLILCQLLQKLPVLPAGIIPAAAQLLIQNLLTNIASRMIDAQEDLIHLKVRPGHIVNAILLALLILFSAVTKDAYLRHAFPGKTGPDFFSGIRTKLRSQLCKDLLFLSEQIQFAKCTHKKPHKQKAELTSLCSRKAKRAARRFSGEMSHKNGSRTGERNCSRHSPWQKAACTDR